MSIELRSLVFSIVACAPCVVVAAEPPLVLDTFDGSAQVENVNRVTDAQAPGVGVYEVIQPDGAQSLSVTRVEGFGRDNVLVMGNTADTVYRAFDGGRTVTLESLKPNQTLQLRFEVRFSGSLLGADNFAFGFVNREKPNSVAYLNIDLSGSDPLDRVSGFYFRSGTFNMSRTPDSVRIDAEPEGRFFEPETVSDRNYTLVFEISRDASGSFVLQYFRDGEQVAIAIADVGKAFATAQAETPITSIAFRHGQQPNAKTYIDHVRVIVSDTPTSQSLRSGDQSTPGLRPAGQYAVVSDTLLP